MRMSHYAIAKIKIKNPSRRVLEKALKKLAKMLDGEVIKNTVAEGYNFRMKVDYLIKMRLPYGNGYGVKINEEGEIEVHVDDHGAPMTAEIFSQELQKYYTAEAVQEALRQLGYYTEVKEDQRMKTIVVEAIGW